VGRGDAREGAVWACDYSGEASIESEDGVLVGWFFELLQWRILRLFRLQRKQCGQQC